MTPEEQKLVDESFVKMELESENLVADRIEQLKALFPEIAVERAGALCIHVARKGQRDTPSADSVNGDTSPR